MDFKLVNIVPYKIKILDALIRKKSIIKLKPYDIAPEQYGILKLVYEGETKLKVSDLAEIANKDKSTITRMISSLVNKSLIIKNTDKNDKRINTIKLTKKGKELIQKIDSNLNQEFQKREINYLENELKIFNKVLDEMILNLQKELA